MWIQLYYINNCVTFPGKAVWPPFHVWHLTAIEKLTKVPVFHQLKCGASTELNVYLSVTRDVAVISIVSLQRQTAKSFVNLLHQAPVEKVMIPRVYSRVRLGLFFETAPQMTDRFYVSKWYKLVKILKNLCIISK